MAYPRKMSEFYQILFTNNWYEIDVEANRLIDFYTEIVVAILTDGEVDDGVEERAKDYGIFFSESSLKDFTTEDIYQSIHDRFWEYVEHDKYSYGRKRL